MLYIVTLRYNQPLEEVQIHLEAHMQWLVQQTQAGHLLAAGPLDDHTGGVLLVSSANRVALDQILEQDPYLVHSVVDASVQGFEPALRAEAFPTEWAATAKAVRA